MLNPGLGETYTTVSSLLSIRPFFALKWKPMGNHFGAEAPFLKKTNVAWANSLKHWSPFGASCASDTTGLMDLANNEATLGVLKWGVINYPWTQLDPK